MILIYNIENKMNASSSISDNESVSFNHDQPSFTTLQVPQPE